MVLVEDVVDTVRLVLSETVAVFDVVVVAVVLGLIVVVPEAVVDCDGVIVLLVESVIEELRLGLIVTLLDPVSDPEIVSEGLKLPEPLAEFDAVIEMVGLIVELPVLVWLKVDVKEFDIEIEAKAKERALLLYRDNFC